MAQRGPRITVDQVKLMLQGPTPPIILDLRSDGAYEAATERISGDVRIPPTEVDQRMGELPKGRPVVTY